MPKKKEQPAAITSMDVREEILSKLKVVYPPLFSDEGKLNKGELEALLKDFEVSDIAKFEFRWAGKMGSKKIAFTSSKARLQADPKRSVDFYTTQNVIIEGENLEVLKLLQKSYFGKVKCIYIDPPYNTGHDFVYSDDYSEDKKAYWEQSGTVNEGVQIDTNTESDGRYHSNWLNMMQARLLLAHKLLRPDGVIFVSIDDNEAHNLRKLMDEVFGEENFVTQIVWENREGGGGSDSKTFKIKHEYILCFAKEVESLNILGAEVEDDSDYPNQDKYVAERGKYKLVKLNSFSIQYSPSLDYPITASDGTEILPSEGGKRGCWRWSKKKYEWGVKNDFIVVKKNEDNGGWTVYTKQYFKVDNEANPTVRTLPPSAVIQEFSSTMAAKQLEEIFGKKKIFDYSKPWPLIERLLTFVSAKGSDDLILDFFAGSGTTGQAVMELNKKDGSGRRFLLIQMPEMTKEGSEARKAGYKTISQITIDRVKKVGARIKSEKPSVDTNYKVFSLTSSLFPENLFVPDPSKSKKENLEVLDAHIAKTKQKLLIDFDKGDLLYEAMLKDGFELNFKAERLPYFANNEVLKISDGSKEALVCLDQTIQDATVKALEAHKDSRFICLHRAVDTTKKWGLDKIFGDSLSFI